MFKSIYFQEQLLNSPQFDVSFLVTNRFIQTHTHTLQRHTYRRTCVLALHANSVLRWNNETIQFNFIVVHKILNLLWIGIVIPYISLQYSMLPKWIHTVNLWNKTRNKKLTKTLREKWKQWAKMFKTSSSLTQLTANELNYYVVMSVSNTHTHTETQVQIRKHISVFDLHWNSTSNKVICIRSIIIVQWVFTLECFCMYSCLRFGFFCSSFICHINIFQAQHTFLIDSWYKCTWCK